MRLKVGVKGYSSVMFEVNLLFLNIQKFLISFFLNLLQNVKLLLHIEFKFLMNMSQVPMNDLLCLLL